MIFLFRAAVFQIVIPVSLPQAASACLRMLSRVATGQLSQVVLVCICLINNTVELLKYVYFQKCLFNSLFSTGILVCNLLIFKCSVCIKNINSLSCLQYFLLCSLPFMFLIYKSDYFHIIKSISLLIFSLIFMRVSPHNY